MNKIDLFDISTSSEMRTNFLKEFSYLLNKNDWVGGDSVVEFENNFSSFLGSKYCVAVNSGTDSLELALKAYNIGFGDKVIVPAFSFFATSEAVLKVGATPVYCDIDKNDLNINVELLNKNMDKDVKAIIPVHLFGTPARMSEINNFAKENGLVVIEDVAQAFGSKIGDNYLGTIGNIGCFSFYPTKNLGGFGDGGCITTDDINIAKKIMSLRNHGQTEKYFHEYVGYNSRLDNIQAVILNLKLQNIDKDLKIRSEISKYYFEYFKNYSEIMLHGKERQPLNLFPISFNSQKKLEKVKEVLKSNSVMFGEYYPYGLHEFPISKHHSGVNLKTTEWATKNILTLPNHPRLKKKDIDYIGSLIASIL